MKLKSFASGEILDTYKMMNLACFHQKPPIIIDFLSLDGLLSIDKVLVRSIHILI